MRQSEPFDDEKAADRHSSSYSSSVYRMYVLGLLTIVYTFNFVDRQLLVILQEPIKADLGLSDTQLGLLTGFTFALFYVVCGIPLARWADRSVRRSIIALALAVWSSMTVLSGFAQNYLQLTLARIGVGVGEAGCSPPAHSMISDTFTPGKRATALAVYSLGAPLGILVGFALGGWLAEHHDWRMAFLVVGAPGILLALLFRASVQEPRRGWSQNQLEVGEAPPFGEVALRLWSFRSFRHLAFATGLQGFVGYGIVNWIPSYFMRTFDLGIGELGTWLALTAGLGGGIGMFFGGYFADLFGKNDKRWYLWLPALSAVLIAPVSFLMLSLDELNIALLLVFPVNLFISVYLGPILAISHSLVSLRMRALTSAILFFVLNLIGMGLGPTCVGLLSDLFASQGYEKDALRHAMLLVSTIVSIWCAVHYLLASRHIVNDLRMADAYNSSRDKSDE